MQYRAFGRLDWKTSVLGFGIMRLPVIAEDQGRIDEEPSLHMVRHAIDQGVNYIDTGYPYHDGHSEAFVGRLLQDGYRQKVKLATKMPSWLIKSAADFDRYFDEQLERLQTECIDLYLLHALNREYWPRLNELGVLGWAEKAMADGRIGHLGFSFHDDFELFRDIVDAYDHWSFCQIQYNYMDTEFQAGTRGLAYAAARGLAVVVMEPLRGGRLTRKPPAAAVELWAGASQKRTLADWALQWLWNQPEVSVVLSGMSTLDQVQENLDSAHRARSGSLRPDELALIDRVRTVYRERCPIDCTQCKYCLPCPHGVNIPRNLEYYNDAVMYEDVKTARNWYQEQKDAERADRCNACGECESLCPQDIAIREWLEKAHALLGTKAAD
jgi:uncharacterized protein